jgi:hypothetical protein
MVKRRCCSHDSKLSSSYLLSTEELFFRACRSNIISASADNFERHKSCISKVLSEDRRVEAYVLPTSIPEWPSFFSMKQDDATEIYFKRVADTNGPRYMETINLLKQRMTVACTGLTGIGKSTEINGLLMDFLSHMGEKGWPGEVWYRYNTDMLKFSLSNLSR